MPALVKASQIHYHWPSPSGNIFFFIFQKISFIVPPVNLDKAARNVKLGWFQISGFFSTAMFNKHCLCSEDLSPDLGQGGILQLRMFFHINIFYGM